MGSRFLKEAKSTSTGICRDVLSGVDVDKPGLDPVQHQESRVTSARGEILPIEALQHVCDASRGTGSEVVVDKARSTPLDFF